MIRAMTVNVWRLITHDKDPDHALRWSLSAGRIAIGWGLIGSVEQMGSAAEIANAIARAYPNWVMPGKVECAFTSSATP